MKNESGYIISAVNEIEYRHAAYSAYSIKSKMPTADVSIVVPSIKKIKKEYLEPFDNLIEFPFKLLTNRQQAVWQMYWTTPYQNTIVLDAKTVIKENQETLWDYLIEHHDICFPTTVKDFKGKKLNPKYQGILSTEYNLTPVYSKQFFFKKDKEAALNYFKLADVYFQSWKDVVNTYLSKHHIPEMFDADLMHTIVAEHSGSDVTALHSNILEYIDMRTMRNDKAYGSWDKWTDQINVWASANAKLKIQNFAINETFHYDESEFLTTEIFNEQRNFYRTITKHV